MKKIRKGILAILCAITAVCAVGGFAACETDGDFTSGEVPVKISVDGYWVIDGLKTKYKAEEYDGSAPVISINESGYWVVDGVSTGKKALDDSGTIEFYVKNGHLYIRMSDDGEPLDLGAVSEGAPSIVQKYTVSFDAGNGQLIPSQEIEEGQKVQNPGDPEKEDYTFLGWYYQEEKWSFVEDVVTCDMTLTAKWERDLQTYTVTLNKNIAVAGVVEGNGNYVEGTEVTLRAQTNEGYTFLGWHDGTTFVSTDATYAFTPAGNVALEARWEKKTYTVTLLTSPESVGTVIGGGTKEHGDNVSISATTTDSDYVFVGWFDEAGEEWSKEATYTLENVTADITLTAKWEKSLDTYLVTLAQNLAEGGTVTGGGNYTEGTQATLQAQTNEGYTFLGWHDGTKFVSADAIYTFTPTGDVTIEARWEKKTYTVTLIASPTTAGTVTEGGTWQHGESGTITATTTDNAYAFKGWYNGDELLTEDLSYNLQNVTMDITLTAKWEAKPIEVIDEWKEIAGYNYYYFTQLGDDVMPIGAWSAPPPEVTDYGISNQITLENYLTLAESGINAIYGLFDTPSYQDDISTDVVLQALECAEQAGMVYFVRDIFAYQLLAENGEDAWADIEYYMSKPAYGGTLMYDEPGYSLFETLGGVMEMWKNKEEYWEEKLSLIPLLPNYSTAEQFYYGMEPEEGTSAPPVDYTNNYEGYLRAYLERVPTQVFSYDFYPFNGYDKTVRREYFEQISVVRKVCMEYNLPFWTFEQVGFYDGGMRDFSYAEIAVQANLSLAYGAKGIQWFNYWQPPHYPESPICGMVDHDGNKTVYYDYVQKVNEQIAAVDHVLMKSKSTGIIEIGSSMFGSIPSEDKVTSYGALTSATGAGGALVGCFEYRDMGYAYYVSSSNTTEDAVVTLNFDGMYNLQKVQDAISSTVTGNSITLSIPAGDGVLIVVPKDKASAGTTYTVNVESEDAAAGVVCGHGVYASGETATIAAAANPGYKFIGWYDGANKVTDSTSYTFTVSGDKLYTAKWDKDLTPVMLNDCELANGEGTFHAYTATKELSTEYVKEGTYSVKATGPSTANLMLPWLTINGAAVTREKLSYFSYLKMDIYADYEVTSGTQNGLNLYMIDRLAVTLQPGWNEVVIPMTEVLAAIDGSANSSPKQLDETGGFYLITYAPGTLYFDNIRMDNVNSIDMLNNCEYVSGWVQSGNTPILSTSNVFEGSSSIEVVVGDGGWINVRILETGINLATLQATYEKITLNVYSSYEGTNTNTLWLGDAVGEGDALTADWNRRIVARLSQGDNVVEIPTSMLDDSMYVTDGAGGYFLSFRVGGASTIRIDNVVGE